MQAYTNTAFLDKRAKIARYTSFVGLGALVGGVLTVANTIWLSYALLVVGLIAATVAAYLTNVYLREPRADKVLSRVLDGLDKRYALYNYYLPSPHVVVSHRGLTVLQAQPQRGEIAWEGGRWKHRVGWRRLKQFFGEPGLGRPDMDLQHEMAKTRGWLAKHYPGAEVPVTGAVVFVHPEANLSITDPGVPVMGAESLPDFFRRGLRDTAILSTAAQTELRKVVDGLVQTADQG